MFLYGTALVNPSLLQIYCYRLLVGRTCKRVDERLVYNAWDGYVSLETSETRLPKISLYILSRLGGPGRPPSVKRKKTLDQHKTKRKPRFKKTLTKQMKYRSIIKKHHYKKRDHRFVPIALALANSPCTLRVNRSPSIFLSIT